MEIPQDIIDNVIAAVGDDKCLLKQCSLVSSSFLLASRKRLFSGITLRNDQTCQGIHQLLVQNPVIQFSVRTITLTLALTDEDTMSSWASTSDWRNGTSLLSILRLPFCCLERFSIIVYPGDCIWRPWDWDSFSSELKYALSNIIRSATLKTLSFPGIKVPNTFFHIVHPMTLELHSLLPSDFGGENSSSLTRAASKGLTPMASDTVIDRCVWHFLGREYCDLHGPFESIFLPFMCHLRFFEIYFDLEFPTMDAFDILSFFIGSLCISLTFPATLEHLELNIYFRDGIINNYFNSYRFYENLRGADVWSHLDSITSHPTGSRLQRVDINIAYSFAYDDDRDEHDEDEVMKAVLDGLPLLRTKGILFVKTTLGNDVAWIAP